MSLVDSIDALPPITIFPPSELTSFSYHGVNRSELGPETAAILDLLSDSLPGHNTPQAPAKADQAALEGLKDCASRLHRPEFRALLRHIRLSSRKAPGSEWELVVSTIDDYLAAAQEIRRHPHRHTFVPSLLPLPHLMPVIQIVRNAAELAVSTGRRGSFERVVEFVSEVIENQLNDPEVNEPFWVHNFSNTLKVRKDYCPFDTILSWFERAEDRWPSMEHKVEILKSRWEWENFRKSATAGYIESLAVRYVELRLQLIREDNHSKQVGPLSKLVGDCKEMGLESHAIYVSVRYYSEIAVEKMPMDKIRMDLSGIREPLTNFGRQLANEIEKAPSLPHALRLIIWVKTPAEFALKPEMPEGGPRIPTNYLNSHGHIEFQVPHDKIDELQQHRGWLHGIEIFGIPLAYQLDAVYETFQPTREDLDRLFPKLTVNQRHDCTDNPVKAFLDYWGTSNQQSWDAAHWASLLLDPLAKEILRANKLPLRKAHHSNPTRIERVGRKPIDNLITDLAKTDFPPAWAEMMSLLATHPVNNTDTGKEPRLGFNLRNETAHLW